MQAQVKQHTRKRKNGVSVVRKHSRKNPKGSKRLSKKAPTKDTRVKRVSQTTSMPKYTGASTIVPDFSARKTPPGGVNMSKKELDYVERASKYPAKTGPQRKSSSMSSSSGYSPTRGKKGSKGKKRLPTLKKSKKSRKK